MSQGQDCREPELRARHKLRWYSIATLGIKCFDDLGSHKIWATLHNDLSYVYLGWSRRHLFYGAPLGAKTRDGEHRPNHLFQNNWALGDNGDLHMRRVIQLAELLFNLQWLNGFDRVLNQLRSDPRGIEGTIAELEVGQLLRKSGVAFKFIEPLGTSRADYDLEVITPDGTKVVADTKCKIESAAATLNTIKSSLDRARGQLPRDLPGFIFIKIPDTWIKPRNEWGLIEEGHSLLLEAIRKFFNGTEHVVSVKAFATAIHLDPDSSLQMNLCFEVDNPRALFLGSWDVFQEDNEILKPLGLQGMHKHWIELVRIVNPLPSRTPCLR